MLSSAVKQYSCIGNIRDSLGLFFEDAEISIHGYNMFRRDRNRYGSGVAVYSQNHIPAKQRQDLMLNGLEALWVQVHLLNLKPIVWEGRLVAAIGPLGPLVLM
jgi:hypothetical protein